MSTVASGFPPPYQSPSRETRRDSAHWSRIAAIALWPLTLFSFVHKVFMEPHTFHVTDDFTTVWQALERFRHGVPVYSENYSLVDPHYLYSPGGTLLLSPLTVMPDFDIARSAYIVVNGLAIVLAMAILTRLFDFSLRGALWPASTLFLFTTESVKNTLLFSNINGLLLLAEVIYLYLLLHDRTWRSQVLAGILLGLAITIKPQFLPLLFIPLIRRQLLAIIAAIAVPVALNLAAWPLMVSPGDYVTRLMPYLAEVRNYANSSILGAGAYFNAPDWLTQAWRILIAVFVATAIIVMLRWKDRDPLMWACTTSGLLFLGVFLISSLGQMYYSMLLAPMMFTVVRGLSVMHNPVVWGGVYLSMSMDEWRSDTLHTLGRAFENIRATVGWSAMVVAVATVIVTWTVLERKQGRPLGGDVATHGLFSPGPCVVRLSRRPISKSTTLDAR